MTDKEKEAIEYFKKEIEQFQKAQESADKEIDDRSWFKKLWCEWQNDIEMRTTVLNLIEKQQAEIRQYEKALHDPIIKDYDMEVELKAEIEKLRNNNKDLLRKLRNRVKEVKKLTRYSLYKKEFSTLNKQLEKKDKIIDEMAKVLADYKYEELICMEVDCEHIELQNEGRCIGDEACIKEYFKKKVEENK